jgi:hypothetical protein
LFYDALAPGIDVRSVLPNGEHKDVITAKLRIGSENPPGYEIPRPIVNGHPATILGGSFHMVAIYTIFPNAPTGGSPSFMTAKISGSAVIGEPGTLAMVGTGLIGLAGMVRRKLKLPT